MPRHPRPPKVRRFEVNGHPFAKPQRDISEAGLHAAIERDLMRGLMYDRGHERHGSRLREHLIDLTHRPAAIGRVRAAGLARIGLQYARWPAPVGRLLPASRIASVPVKSNMLIRFERRL